MSLDEKITASALAVTVALWIFGGQLGIGSVAAALLGLAILLITNVTTWKNCLSDNQVRWARLPLRCKRWALNRQSASCTFAACGNYIAVGPRFY